jgi:phage replication-related protein YjqB (UPF0714/DUF867 family)
MNQHASHNRSYRINKAWQRQTQLLSDGDYCSLRDDIADTLGRHPGQQIRLDPVSSAGVPAAFTVGSLHTDDADIRIGKAGRQRLRVGPSSVVTARPTVSRTELNRMQACAQGDVCETVWDTGQDHLLVCAPHGGDIESNTVRVTRRIQQELGSARATAWFVHAFGNESAFERWHITTTEMSPVSYPGLAQVANRSFQYAVSIHTWRGDDILIGGLAEKELRERLADSIRSAIDGVRDIVTDHDEGKYMATTEQNVVNRLTDDNASGIQIELPELIALQYRGRVAQAVADCFDSVLSVNQSEYTH